MNHNQFMRATTVIFGLIALLHAVRLFSGWGLMVHTYLVPMWMSIIAVAVAGFMAWTGYKFLK